MNVRIEQEETPEGRVAAAARVTMMRSVQEGRRRGLRIDETLLPDYADLREGIREALRRELLIAELEGLSQGSEKARSRRRDEILRELAPKKT